MPISYIKASGADIQEIVSDIEEVIGDRPNSHVAIASIIVAIFAQKPDIAPEELQRVVLELSEWLMARLFNESENESVN